MIEQNVIKMFNVLTGPSGTNCIVTYDEDREVLSVTKLGQVTWEQTLSELTFLYITRGWD
jgi:hypothetical protein